MSDRLRYRLIDEPRPSPLQRFALPPLLVFLAAQYFLPWGSLLVALNALALNGPQRNREIGLAAMPIVAWFVALFVLNIAVNAGVLKVSQAHYFFVVAVGLGLMFIATAYVSQQRTADLRQYLRQQG